MKSKPLILAKASLTKEQIEVKENAGAEGIEIQLLIDWTSSSVMQRLCMIWTHYVRRMFM